MRHHNEHKLSVLQVRRPEQNTATQRLSQSSQSRKNIRQFVKTGKQNTLSATSAKFTTAKM